MLVNDKHAFVSTKHTAVYHQVTMSNALRYILTTNGSLVAYLERKRGTLSWVAFAARLEAPVITVTEWRRGRTSPRNEYLRRLGLLPSYEVLEDRPFADVTRKKIKPYHVAQTTEALTEHLTKRRGQGSWSDLADSIGSTRASIHDWLKGRTTPNAILLEALGLAACAGIIDDTPFDEAVAKRPAKSRDELLVENRDLRAKLKNRGTADAANSASRR